MASAIGLFLGFAIGFVTRTNFSLSHYTRRVSQRLVGNGSICFLCYVIHIVGFVAGFEVTDIDVG